MGRGGVALTALARQAKVKSEKGKVKAGRYAFVQRSTFHFSLFPFAWRASAVNT
jgi:hypothetical protein